jgi:hypothetical protein
MESARWWYFRPTPQNRRADPGGIQSYCKLITRAAFVLGEIDERVIPDLFSLQYPSVSRAGADRDKQINDKHHFSGKTEGLL